MRLSTCTLLATLLACAWGGKITNLDVDPSLNEVDSTTNIEREQDASLPANVRYPSAVLFSGICGGTIISPKWILTAAHCSLSRHGIRKVLAGTGNSTDDSGVSRLVKRLVVHPQFSVGPYWLDAAVYNFTQIAAHWDFMLAELEEPLPLDGKLIVAAELDDTPEHPAGQRVGFAGYGTDVFGHAMSHLMHASDLEMKSNEECAKLEQFNPQDMLCAQGIPPKNYSACSGDSGSGLIRDGRLLGVLSWVEDDALMCEPGKKVVAVRVAAVRDWIRRVANV